MITLANMPHSQPLALVGAHVRRGRKTAIEVVKHRDAIASPLFGVSSPLAPTKYTPAYRIIGKRCGSIGWQWKGKQVALAPITPTGSTADRGACVRAARVARVPAARQLLLIPVPPCAPSRQI